MASLYRLAQTFVGAGVCWVGIWSTWLGVSVPFQGSLLGSEFNLSYHNKETISFTVGPYMMVTYITALVTRTQPCLGSCHPVTKTRL